MKKTLLVIVAMIVFVGVWNACDFAYNTWLAEETSGFSVGFNVISPIITFLLLYKTSVRPRSYME